MLLVEDYIDGKLHVFDKDWSELPFACLLYTSNRDLNYDKFVVKGEVHTTADESYTSHNTDRLDVEGTVKKILTTEYVQNALKGIPNV